MRTLSGDFAWLEAGVLDPSEAKLGLSRPEAVRAPALPATAGPGIHGPAGFRRVRRPFRRIPA